MKKMMVMCGSGVATSTVVMGKMASWSLKKIHHVLDGFLIKLIRN